MRHVRRIGLVAAVAVMATDQTSKAWALRTLWPPYSDGISVLPVLNLRLGFNTGVTFGLFRDSAAEAVWLMVAGTLAITLYVAWLLWRSSTRLEAAAFGLVIGGALGNVADRIRIGAVVDFIDAHYGGWHWPTFNLADAAIVCGVTVLVLLSLRTPAADAPAGTQSKRRLS